MSRSSTSRPRSDGQSRMLAALLALLAVAAESPFSVRHPVKGSGNAALTGFLPSNWKPAEIKQRSAVPARA